MQLKSIFILFFLISGSLLFGQVTTEPALPVVNQEVRILYDATQGTAGLKDYIGDIYAHTGVITDKSTSGSDWKYAPTWGDNSAKYKLTRIEDNLYELIISPDILDYYGVPEGEKVLKMAFVFRSGAYKPGTTQYYEGKATGGSDIFVDVYEAELAVGITFPSDNAVIPKNTQVSLTAASTQSAGLSLFLDGSLLKQAEGTDISVDYTFSEGGVYSMVAVAESEGKTATDTVNFMVKDDVIVETKPVAYRKGINYISDTSVALVLWAPYKEFVFVLGDFNDWQVSNAFQMKKDGDYFWLEIEGLTPGQPYVFQYYIDSEIYLADPYAEQTSDPLDVWIPSSSYPGLIPYPAGKARGIASVLETGQTPYAWEVEDFTPPPVDQLVIYELLIRDFSVSRTYRAVTEKLDYLKELNVNVIELMPVNEFEGNESWGYNPSFYFAPDKYYGHRNDLKKLIDEAHKRGIAVVIDMVLNHSMGQSPFARMYLDESTWSPSSENPWYNTAHNFQNTQAQWGYDFNHESAHTRALIDSINSFWMHEYKVDGFRFDFTKGFSNTPYGSSDPWGSAYDAPRIANLKRMADEVWKRNENAIVIFEHLSDNTEEKELAEYGILLWGKMSDEFGEAAKGNSADLRRTLHTSRNWNVPHLVGYMESHDEERMVYKLLQSGGSEGAYSTRQLPVALDRVELSASFLLPLPGPKMIWQFGELGYDYSINTCSNPAQVSPDCRLAPKPVLWNYFDRETRKDVYKLMSRLNYLKQNYAEFSSPEYQGDLTSQVKWYRLSKEGQHVMVAGNFSLSEKTVNLTFPATGTWHDYFSNTTLQVTQSNVSLTLQPGEYKLYTTRKMADPYNLTFVQDPIINSGTWRIFPNPASTEVTIQSGSKVRQAVIRNISGQVIRLVEFAGDLYPRISVSDIPEGLYLISIDTESGMFHQKLVISGKGK